MQAPIILFCHIYRILVNVRKIEGDDEVGRNKALGISLMLTSLLISFNLILPLSYFVKWYPFITYIWVVLIALLYFLIIATGKYKTFKVDDFRRTSTLAISYILLTLLSLVAINKIP